MQPIVDSLIHSSAMKKLVTTLAIAMLAAHLPAPTQPPLPTLLISDLGGGNFQIIASNCGYQSQVELSATTDFVNWTAISTNTASDGGVVTNIVQATNSMNFYRAAVSTP